MYKRILVALDGSELAERVLPHVESLAKQYGAQVTVLRATTPPESIIAGSFAGAMPVASAAIDPMPIIESERRDAAEYLRSVAKRLSASGVSVDVEMPEASAADAILDRAQELGADMIAMTTHGRGGLGRLVFGSVAEAVLRRSRRPVLVIRVDEDQAP
jgi:nucleotide-binding universal stress UspA family protein